MMIGVLAVGCGKSAAITPLGPARPALAAGCPVNIIHEGQPAYPHVDIAKVQVRCWVFEERDRCLMKLLRATCAAGGDTVYGFAERAQDDLRMVAAVIAYRPGQPAPAAQPPPPPVAGLAP